MELENTTEHALAKLPCSKTRGSMSCGRSGSNSSIFRYQGLCFMGGHKRFGNSWVPIPVTTSETGTSTNNKVLGLSTIEENSNNINTVNPEVSTGTTKVNTASTEISTASFSDATVYAFLSTQPQGSQLVHEDLEQLHDVI
ncbi:hypothetical protein Tco_0625719 [Tanacetum coccineum]|uniref:Uncharacterized protein n=1 Tax=Tanacetum coccineum TaxID=301880 RepID=A0ABQ4WHP1_9ASTR